MSATHGEERSLSECANRISLRYNARPKPRTTVILSPLLRPGDVPNEDSFVHQPIVFGQDVVPMHLLPQVSAGRR